jgi:hypothetical protein
MLNVCRKLTVERKSRDGNPCPNDRSEDLKHAGKMTFWET